MFGFIKRVNDPERNYRFHVERVNKLLIVAFERFSRADAYLGGEGFGGDLSKLSAAQGAEGRAQSALGEAIFNAQKAIKFSLGDKGKIEAISSIVKVFIEKKGDDLFAHPLIVERWDKSMALWSKEFESLSGVNECHHDHGPQTNNDKSEPHRPGSSICFDKYKIYKDTSRCQSCPDLVACRIKFICS